MLADFGLLLTTEFVTSTSLANARGAHRLARSNPPREAPP